MNKEPIFHNKDKTLTRYALACGYIESYHNERLNIYIKLELDGNSYAVKAFDHANCKRIAWDNFDLLKLARKRFRELKRSYKGATR